MMRGLWWTVSVLSCWSCSCINKGGNPVVLHVSRRCSKTLILGQIWFWLLMGWRWINLIQDLCLEDSSTWNSPMCMRMRGRLFSEESGMKRSGPSGVVERKTQFLNFDSIHLIPNWQIKVEGQMGELTWWIIFMHLNTTDKFALFLIAGKH